MVVSVCTAPGNSAHPSVPSKCIFGARTPRRLPVLRRETMQSTRWLNRAPRAIVVPAAFVLGAVAVIGLRGNAGQHNTTPPVQPPVQALDIQTAFEQVADKLRPSVVYIKSRQTIAPTSSFRQGADNGDDN